MQEDTHKASYFIHNLNIVIGLVLIWRGIWHILDTLEAATGIDKGLAAAAGVVIGLILLYAPDHDLKELQKL